MNVAQARDRMTGHTTGLIMHWIDKCADPAHKNGGGSTVATNPHSHRDQLVDRREPGSAANGSLMAPEDGKRSMEEQ